MYDANFYSGNCVPSSWGPEHRNTTQLIIYLFNLINIILSNSSNLLETQQSLQGFAWANNYFQAGEQAKQELTER